MLDRLCPLSCRKWHLLGFWKKDHRLHCYCTTFSIDDIYVCKRNAKMLFENAHWIKSDSLKFWILLTLARLTTYPSMLTTGHDQATLTSVTSCVFVNLRALQGVASSISTVKALQKIITQPLTWIKTKFNDSMFHHYAITPKYVVIASRFLQAKASISHHFVSSIYFLSLLCEI